MTASQFILPVGTIIAVVLTALVVKLVWLDRRAPKRLSPKSNARRRAF
jgi:hypothetical protein